ncbi:hypothetical protein IAD21_00692 [Abditibacteriota bacterium]|nr:hypothetical protein IAD21_00692 [Abditibacteriota bacterium]
MSFALSDYRNIPSSGVIPAAMVPADQISFAYSFTYQKDVDTSAGLQSSLIGRVVLELKDAAGTLKATFDLRETYRLTLLPLAPGLLAYIWNWDSNKEQFSAVDAEGNPLTTEGQFSLGVIPAGDSDTSDRTAYVSSKFYSFIFNVDVNEGDVLKIKFHNLSAGTVVSKASLQVATRLGSKASPALVDGRCGQQFRVSTDADAKGTRLIRSRRLDSPLELAQTEWTEGNDGLISDKPLGSAHLTQTEGNTLYVLGTSKDQLLLFRSQNEGKTWKAIMSEPTNLKILAAHLASGGRYIIYGTNPTQKPTYAILKHGQDQWTLSETGPCTLLPPTTPSTVTPATLPTSKVSALEAGEGGALRLLAQGKDGVLLIWLSRDGKTWKQSATPE